MGNDAVFTAAADQASGQLHWTPGASDKGNFRVTFTALNALAGNAGTTLRITRNAPVVASSPATGSEAEAPPATLALSRAAPNPSSGDVAFTLALPRSARVDWSVHDLQGRTLWSEAFEHEAGRVVFRWDGTTLSRKRPAPGVYLVRVRVDGEQRVRRFVRW